MASSSSALQNPESSAFSHTYSASNAGWDVFISHRGPDVKKTFASYLYRRLRVFGLRVFLDQLELQSGFELTSQIGEAIATASINVVIFSPGYAESVWCLNELLLMLQSRASILPVFYNVRRSEVKWTSGNDGVYARALHRLEKKSTFNPQTGEKEARYDSATIESWRKALSVVSDISGFDLDACNGDETELLENVVEYVLKRQRTPSLFVTKFPVGLDDKVEDFENKVLSPLQSGKPRVVGIVGLGGVGKTTLAKELFNRKRSSFSGSCFLADVRETAGRSSLHFLQSKLLKDLTNLDIEVDSVTDGFKKHLPSVYGHDAILILDDVDHVDQLNALLPVQNYLPSNSLILITSRNKDVLILSGVEESSIYELSGLDLQHSRELFCCYAFSQPHPVSGFEDFVDEFIRVCDGLPLSLKVFGALLYRQNEFYWEELLDDVRKKQIETTVFSLAKHPPGLDGKVQDFEDKVLLQQQNQKLQVVGIVGVDGIGKTTLAKELFQRKKSSYPESCILYDVRINSLNSLLNKLLKGLTQLDRQVESVDEGIDMLKERVSSSPAFIILDNVGHPEQLHALLSVLTVLPSGSIILITSPDKGVLERAGVKQSSIYLLSGLNRQDSLHLFCSHAFDQPNPLPGFESLVDDFVMACNGLPLTLKIFGALLRGKSDSSYWHEQLDKLQQSPNDIKRKLEITYDSLSEEEQHIFLYIACSCIGEKRDLAVSLWDGSRSGALLRFEDLQKRCLVDVDSEDCLIMNGHLRDLGRTIADQKNLRGPLWLPMENKSHLLQQSFNEQVVAELRRKIDDLSQQSSVIREVRGFMILIVIMMVILLIMILAMMIWSMGLER